MEYALTYAGVPFCLDQAQVVRIDNTLSYKQEDSEQQYPRKHQPMADLVDELNRIIPFKYLQDFATPDCFSSKNLSAIARYNEVGPMPNTEVMIGDWYYPHSASRWSVFRGLMLSSAVKEVLRITSGRERAEFLMKCVPYGKNADSYTLRSNLYMLPPRPLAEHGGKFDGLYLVTLVDERYYWQFGGVTVHVNQNTRWADIITQLSQQLGFSIASLDNVTQYKPEPDSQLWTNIESAPVIMDAISHALGSVWVRELDGRYNLFQSMFSRQTAYTNRGSPNIVVRAAGGDIFSSGEKIPAGNLNAARNAILPETVTVTFPKYIVGDDPVPHFVNPRYQNQRPSCWYEDSYGDTYSVTVPLLSGAMQFSGQLGVFISGSAQLRNGIPFVSSGLTGTSGYNHSLHCTAKALYSGEVNAASGAAPVNSSGLVSLAMQLAQDYFNRQIDIALDEVYEGTYNWSPEGIHDIVWTWSARAKRATTRVLRTQWNLTVDEVQHSASAMSGCTNVPKGVGGPSVAQSWRDSTSGSNQILTTLGATLLSGDMSTTITDASYFPTQNRWKGRIDAEILLFEGTSGGTSLSIVQRGIDGTIQTQHENGTIVRQLLPNTTYGVNLVTHEKMQWIFPHDITSGGIQGVNVVPQTQTVYVFSASGVLLNQIHHYSGILEVYDSTMVSGSEYLRREYVWVVNRNGEGLRSGKRYDGQFAGFSPTPANPIYLINSRRVVVEVTCDEDGLHVFYGYT